MLLYYITDRRQLPGTEAERRAALLTRIAQAAAAGIDLIQLREKDLSGREIEGLGADALRVMRKNSATARLLVNSRVDVALAIGADGVHLTSTDISAGDARAIWGSSLDARDSKRDSRGFSVGVSCHSPGEVLSAESQGADFAVLAPIFEKVETGSGGIGLEPIRRAVRLNIPPDRRVEAGDQRTGMPVLALGGVNVGNAVHCLRAGASGIAAIRLFQEGDVRETVSKLRELEA